jgi:predicted kinase
MAQTRTLALKAFPNPCPFPIFNLMEMVLFIGLPASGKSSFYRERFFRTHLRINLDMLKTRRREELLVRACFEGKTKFVVENTNLTRESRAKYILPARAAGFATVGYLFETTTADAIRRNALRADPERVLPVAIYAAARRLELPSKTEGFDQLFRVQLTEPQGFLLGELESTPSSGASYSS